MEVRFTPEEEARIAEIATQEGVAPAELVKDAAMRLLEEDTRFRAGVRKGIEQANRGEFIEEEEMGPASSECSNRDAGSLDVRGGGRPRAH